MKVQIAVIPLLFQYPLVCTSIKGSFVPGTFMENVSIKVQFIILLSVQTSSSPTKIWSCYILGGLPVNIAS